MNIVIIGDGKIGSTLAEQLLREGHDIVVVDNDAEVLENSAKQDESTALLIERLTKDSDY